MFDVLTVGAVAGELERTILDGRIQRIGLVDQLTVAAEVYAKGQRRGLVASADSGNARILLTDAMPSVDTNLITPFGLLLRKYVRGAYLIGVEQPPLERMVRLIIAKRMPPINPEGAKKRYGRDAEMAEMAEMPAFDAVESEEPEEFAEDDIWSAPDVVRFELIVEIMGRHSNIVLVDADGLIMESVKRVTPQMSRVRSILPRKPYTLPPVQDKPDPRQLTSAGVEGIVRSAKPGAAIAETLVRGLRGISPQIGKEAAFRLTGDAKTSIDIVGANEARDLARIVRGLFEPLLTGAWDPTVYERNDDVVAYAASAMGFLAADSTEIKVESISEAIEMSLEAGAGTETISPKAHAQRRVRVVAAIDAAMTRVESRLHSYREQHAKTADLERLRTWGELIFAYIWQISPGDTELIVDDQRIALDPTLSAKENAQELFDKYRRAKSAGAQLPERIAETENEVEYLKQLRLQAEQSEGFAAIESLRQEFEDHTGGRQSVGEKNPQRGGKKGQPRRVTPLADAEGNLIYIGRSGRENEQVTFDIGGPNDTWLHARGVPGSHVIVRWLRPDEETDAGIEAAAALAAFYSGSRTSGTVEVDVAKRRDVRKIKGGGPGMVTYRNEYTVPVRPMNEGELKQEGRLG
jgi:predicted ribosome quality control (RQC) complex YloA/Tae2 family protein